MSLYLATIKMVIKFPATPTRNKQEHIIEIPVRIGTGKLFTGCSPLQKVALSSQLQLNEQLEPFVQVCMVVRHRYQLWAPDSRCSLQQIWMTVIPAAGSCLLTHVMVVATDTYLGISYPDLNSHTSSQSYYNPVWHTCREKKIMNGKKRLIFLETCNVILVLLSRIISATLGSKCVLKQVICWCVKVHHASIYDRQRKEWLQYMLWLNIGEAKGKFKCWHGKS